jgi:UMF1 family MFS transporter
MMEVKVDGEVITQIDTYSETNRYDVTETIEVESVGTHELTLTLVTDSEESLAIRDVTVLPAKRTSNLGYILGLIGAVQVGALLFTVLGGAHLVSGLAETLTTKRSILLSLFVYSIIAIWGYFVDSSLDFWLLAWMVGIVQGGSQALSRSLYAALSPASKSGEFFGFFSTMSKFSSITGPLTFAAVISIFGNSRPVLSLIALFIVGGVLLAQVDVQAGKRHADEDNSSTPA